MSINKGLQIIRTDDGNIACERYIPICSVPDVRRVVYDLSTAYVFSRIAKMLSKDLSDLKVKMTDLRQNIYMLSYRGLISLYPNLKGGNPSKYFIDRFSTMYDRLLSMIPFEDDDDKIGQDCFAECSRAYVDVILNTFKNRKDGCQLSLPMNKEGADEIASEVFNGPGDYIPFSDIYSWLSDEAMYLMNNMTIRRTEDLEQMRSGFFSYKVDQSLKNRFDDDFFSDCLNSMVAFDAMLMPDSGEPFRIPLGRSNIRYMFHKVVCRHYGVDWSIDTSGRYPQFMLSIAGKLPDIIVISKDNERVFRMIEEKGIQFENHPMKVNGLYSYASCLQSGSPFVCHAASFYEGSDSFLKLFKMPKQDFMLVIDTNGLDRRSLEHVIENIETAIRYIPAKGAKLISMLLAGDMTVNKVSSVPVFDGFTIISKLNSSIILSTKGLRNILMWMRNDELRMRNRIIDELTEKCDAFLSTFDIDDDDYNQAMISHIA